jgi:hypothetical protein
MSELRTSAAGLLQLATAGTLAERISEQLRMSGHGVGPAERRSWERSLPILAQDLVDAGLDQVEILVEYRLPLTSMRVDAVLAGVHPRTREDSFVVIELKQWGAATLFEESPRLVVVDHVRQPRLHPGLQVAGYCEYLVDFLGTLHGEPQAVAGAAYLHNALDLDVGELFALPPTEHSRIFTQAAAWAVPRLSPDTPGARSGCGGRGPIPVQLGTAEPSAPCPRGGGTRGQAQLPIARGAAGGVRAGTACGTAGAPG